MIHGGIGVLEQQLGVLVIERVKRDARSKGDTNTSCLASRNGCETHRGLSGDAPDIGHMRHVRQSTTVNSSPPRRATVSPGRTQPDRRAATPFSNRVASIILKGIVHQLEAVEVEIRDRHQALMALGFERGLPNPVEQQQPVGHPVRVS